MSFNNDPPNVMRAWTHTKAGHPSSVLSLSSKIPIPALSSPGSVRIQISHTALHIGGSIMMQLCPFIFRSSPAIPETDFSGTVVETSAEVQSSGRDISPGTSVFGSILVGPHLSTGAGALAEYVVVNANSVCRKPEKASFEEAAGLAVSGCTALALMDKAGLKRGDSVLINGASGNVGHLVLQMARDAVGESGRVTAICSARNEEMVRNLGADEVGSS
jgi:NADPH:quinone reductase-like Zn-dependent oxidoreductase